MELSATEGYTQGSGGVGSERRGRGLLQELPEQWTTTKKLAFQVKQNVAPLQANEVSILRRKCQQFEVGYLHP